jgi:transcription elongation factor GreA
LHNLGISAPKNLLTFTLQSGSEIEIACDEVDVTAVENDDPQRAVDQLNFLRTVKRAEVAQYLDDIKQSGDVIDNPAYKEATNQFLHLEHHIHELEEMVAKAQLVETSNSGIVALGSTIHLRTAEGREYRYRLVGAFEAKPSAGRISNESPIGKALLGHKVGDLVVVTTPGGVKEYTILSIE